MQQGEIFVLLMLLRLVKHCYYDKLTGSAITFLTLLTLFDNKKWHGCYWPCYMDERKSRVTGAVIMWCMDNVLFLMASLFHSSIQVKPTILIEVKTSVGAKLCVLSKAIMHLSSIAFKQPNRSSNVALS